MPADDSSVTGPARPAVVAPVSLGAVLTLLGPDTAVSTTSGGPALSGSEAASVVLLTGVSLNSATVRAGDLYAALPGRRTHGARFAQQALDAGALAVLTDSEGSAQLTDVEVPVVIVADPRAQLGRVADLVYGSPSAALTLIGITGTHGKTTTTQLMAAGAEAAGLRSAVVGTLGTWIGGTPVGGHLTTPEAPDLHALFAVMRERGVEICAMEVSSHALVMGRVDGVTFDLAVFTNLGRDHLDFHATVEDYFAAKAGLFTPERAGRALVNTADAYGRRLVEQPSVPTLSFATGDGDADWTAEVTASDGNGSRFDLVSPDGDRWPGSVCLPGAFNVTNALCAIAALAEVGCDARAVTLGVAAVPVVAGRMEAVDEGQAYSVVVDYAHKPDAVSAALGALRSVTSGRLVIVVGAGGDRDTGKRPLMGAAAALLADLLVVTDDNPRDEDPALIRSEIVAGARSVADGAQVVEIGDRGEAIRYALTAAREGDTVLVAGKGHETGQEAAGRVQPFDDRETARRILREIASTGALS